MSFKQITYRPKQVEDLAHRVAGIGVMVLLLAIFTVFLLPGWFGLLALLPGVLAGTLIFIGGTLLDWSIKTVIDDFDRAITLQLPWQSEPRYYIPIHYTKDPHRLAAAQRHELVHCQQFERYGMLGFYWRYAHKETRMKLEAEAFAENVKYWLELGEKYIIKGGKRYTPLYYYASVLVAQYKTGCDVATVKQEISKWL